MAVVSNLLFLLLSLTNAQGQSLDANDVSLLIPHQRQLSVPEIKLDSDLELITPEIFSQILTFEHPNSQLSRLPYMEADTLADRANWKITSLRYNPCDDSIRFSQHQQFNILIGEKNQGCQPKLRIVAQPFDFRGFPLATALHLLYHLDESQAQLTLTYLDKIKRLTESNYNIKTSGMPLQIHPGLAQEHSRQLNDGPVASAVKEMVKVVLSDKHPAKQKLKILTMTVRESVDQWKLVGGTVIDGKWSPFTTPFNLNFYLKDGALAAPQVEKVGVEVIHCNQNNVCYSLPNSSPDTQTNRGVLTQAFNRTASEQGQLLTQNEKEVLAEKIDQPLITNFFNTNCISCHESSNMRNKQQLVSALQWPSGVTPFTPRDYVTGKLNNLINFGYDGTVARISSRTAAETAGVVDFLNRQRNQNNTGFVPPDLSQFWNCLTNHLNWKECINH